MKNTTIILLIIAFTGLVFVTSAKAHKVNLFAYVENNTVYVEGYFPNGQPVMNGKIEVYDSNEQNRVQGTTDAKGLFAFPIPVIDNLTIVIDASMGHRGEFHLNKNDLAAVKATMEKPGITEIIGGIGYILGLFGIGYYIYARSILKAQK